MSKRKVKFQRASILRELTELVAGIGDNNVFCHDRPTAKMPGMEKFVVVRLPQGVRSASAIHSTSYCQIVVFAKDNDGGLEDTLTLEEMSDSVCELFPIVTPLFSATEPKLLNGGNDGLGFHALIIQAKLIIHKQLKI